jgi:AraC-like DNA-binding protein
MSQNQLTAVSEMYVISSRTEFDKCELLLKMDSVTTININPALSFLGIVNLVGATQGLLLAAALLSSKGGNKTANRLLAALTFAISIIVSGAVLLTSNYVFVYPHLSRIHHPFVFAAGPLLFLYIRGLTSEGKRFEREDFLHFIPFALCVIYLLPYYVQSSKGKLNVVASEYLEASFGQWYFVRSSLFIVQFLVYLVLIVLAIVQYSRRVKRRELPRDETTLSELRFFVIASSVLWVGAVLRYTLDSTARTNLLVPLGASVVIYGMGYLKMRRPRSLTDEVASEVASEEPGEELQLSTKKYEKSTLTGERAERYLSRLLQCMKEKKPFTDGDLSLQKLAQGLSISPHHLSQIINERLGQTFSDFINSYRVEEAKRRLLDPAFKHLSLLGIAIDVGFNSKSSFNSVFKKHTNMTPSEFRNGLNGSNGDR